MIRFGRLNLALALILMLPAVAAAQKETKQTKEANKYLGLAMAKQDPAERSRLYEQAMVHLREAQQTDAQNARVWLMSGTVLAGLGQLVEADAAFDRAQQLHADYADDIEAERESAWITAFNAGLEKMEARDYAGAIQTMETAQIIYAQRPEALMNLGALYANQNELDKAEKAFRDAIESTKGPLFAKLDAEGQAAWLRFRDMANLNLAQMAGARGVERFETKEFVKAATDFLAATELNPHARDYWFNVAQAYWAQSAALETTIDSMPAADQAAAKQQLIRLYGEVVKYAQKTRTLDPNSEMLYLIEAQSERRMGEANGAPDRVKQGQERALALLEAAEELPVTVSDVLVIPSGDGTAKISGKLRGKKLTAGAPVTLHFTVVGLDGKVIGEQDVNVTVGPEDTDTDFEATIESVSTEIAGWKYMLRS